MLGVPVAQSIATERLETILTGRIEQRVEKLKAHLLGLAARVTIANGLILGCVWYLQFLWAGKTFLTRIQPMVDNFVWTGRSQVARTVVSMLRKHGGLGLINIADQHRALGGNLMV